LEHFDLAGCHYAGVRLMSESFNINYQKTADYIAHENTNAMITDSGSILTFLGERNLMMSLRPKKGKM